MAEYLDYEGLEYYHGKFCEKLADELGSKQTQLDALGSSIDSLTSGKVDKVSGKDLSSNDFTDAYKAMLDSGLDGDFVPYELLTGSDVDLNDLVLTKNDPPRKIYFAPHINRLVRNSPLGNENAAFMLEVSKTSQSLTGGSVTVVQRLFYYPAMGLSRGDDVFGSYTRSRAWYEPNSQDTLTWTDWVKDDHAKTAEYAESIKQSYISGSDHAYPLLASGDYDLTQGDFAGTPFKMHSLTFNPKTGILTANKFSGSLLGNASTASYASSAGTANSAASADSAALANSIEQSYISGSDHDYPILASGDYSKTIGDITGTPYKMHSLTFNPKTGTLTANKFSGDLNGTASSAAYAANAGTAISAASAANADLAKESRALLCGTVVDDALSGNNAGLVWHKAASWKCTPLGGKNTADSHVDNEINFFVSQNYPFSENKRGILSVHLRTEGKDNAAIVMNSSSYAVWTVNTGFAPENFVVTYTKTADREYSCELWVNILSIYTSINFAVISAKKRLGETVDVTLYNGWSNETRGASYPAADGHIVSKNAAIKNRSEQAVTANYLRNCTICDTNANAASLPWNKVMSWDVSRNNGNNDLMILVSKNFCSSDGDASVTNGHTDVPEMGILHIMTRTDTPSSTNDLSARIRCEWLVNHNIDPDNFLVFKSTGTNTCTYELWGKTGYRMYASYTFTLLSAMVGILSTSDFTNASDITLYSGVGYRRNDPPAPAAQRVYSKNAVLKNTAETGYGAKQKKLKESSYLGDVLSSTEWYEITVTGLKNYSTLLVRHASGDAGTLEYNYYTDTVPFGYLKESGEIYSPTRYLDYAYGSENSILIRLHSRNCSTTSAVIYGLY